MRILRSVLLLLLLLAGAAMPVAAAPEWVRTNLFGGSIGALAQAPSAPGTLYATARWFGEMYRSRDGGATWHVRGRLPQMGFPVRDLAVDPHDPGILYAWTAAQLQRSPDGGLSWSPIGSELPGVEALAWRGGVLHAATHRGLYRSADGGDTWQVEAFGAAHVSGLAADPATGALLAVAGEEEVPAVLWKSMDDGATWAQVSVLPLPPLNGIGSPHFAFDPVRPGTLYVWFFRLGEPGSEEGPLLRSRDGGATWAELEKPGFSLRDLVPRPDGTLLAGLESGGLRRSHDLGDTWDPVDGRNPVPNASVLRLVTFPEVPGKLLAAGDGGLWVSTDGGARWAASNRGLTAVELRSLSVSPTGPSFLLAVAFDGVFRSVDQGVTWTRIHSEDPGPQPWDIRALDPRRPRTMYGFDWTGQADFLVRSTDGGRSWHALSVPYDCESSGSICSIQMPAFALDPEHPDTLYVGGTYFTHHRGSGPFLVRSDDAFTTWENLNPLPGLRALFAARGPQGALYGLTCARLWRSLDAGRTWQKVGRGLPRAEGCSDQGSRLSGYGSLSIDPGNPQRLYLATSKGVYTSSDGGTTFSPMNRGLEPAWVGTVVIDPTDSTQLYVAASRGLFRWSAARRTWLLVAGLPAGAGFSLVIDPQHPSVLYAGGSRSIFRIDLGALRPEEDSAR